MTRLRPRTASPPPTTIPPNPRLNLLDLPYDIRHLIYQHLLPPGPQLYLQAFGETLTCISPEASFPKKLFLTNRQLSREANEFLYNNYLFNILGTKRDCLDTYGDFEQTVRKYARKKVHVDAFSNGLHSKTMCISIHVGDGKTEMLERRERGVRKSIAEVRLEVESLGKEDSWSLALIQLWEEVKQYQASIWISSATLVVLLAVLIAIVTA